ncbi:Proteasome activator complex subunit 3 [Trichuris trichiura]|uniref:Proteasome activator complex subunit 3 n=1 Tax=Trichuris trichiura TaxID=36087 RepID=A0A077ZFH5_TRITR|nr:Proteasome activator complex subunit 3 [Trichuris trichiura]
MPEDDQAPILKLLLIEKAEESYRTLIFEQFLSCAEEVNKIWTSIPVSPPFGSRLTDVPIPLIVEEAELEEKGSPPGYLHYVRKKKSDFGAQYPEAEEKEPPDLITACEDKVQGEQSRRSSGQEKRRRSPVGPPTETANLNSSTSEDKNANIPSRVASLDNSGKNGKHVAGAVLDNSKSREVTCERLHVGTAAESKTASKQSPLAPCKASTGDRPIQRPRLSTPPTNYEPADKDNRNPTTSAARKTSFDSSCSKTQFSMATASWLDNIDFLSDAYMTTTEKLMPKETIGDIPDVLTPLEFLSDVSDSDNPILSTAHIESWEDDKDAFLLNGFFVRDASDDVTDPDEITQPKREPISLNLPTFPSLCDQSVRMDEITVPEEAKVAIWSHGANNIQSNQAIRLLHSTLGQQLGKAIMNCHRASSLAYLYIPLAELSVTVARIIVDHFNEWLEILLSKQSCISKYYLRRAELLKDIIAMPHLEDCRLALYWMDVQEYESCRERLQQIEEFYLTMHEEVRRNWSSLYEGRKVKGLLDY